MKQLITIKLITTIVILVLCGLCDTYNCKIIETKKYSKYGDPLYLTPLVEDGEIVQAQKLAKVYMKGAQNIESYSGLFTVDKKYNSTLYFWYFVSEQKPKTAPILLWLNGGPGTTSLLGLFQEHGPVKVNDDIELELREHYWTKNHHVIYLDSPVGTGFSYTNDDRGYATNTKDVARNVYKALTQFFTLFPNLKGNDFYLTGESYAGKYIPGISHRIIKKGGFSNFKGVAIGNGLTDPVVQVIGVGEYLYQQGFIDDHIREEFRTKEKECSEIIEIITKTNTEQNPLEACRQIMDPFSNNTLFYNATGYTYVYNILESQPPFEEDAKREKYLDKASVRKAIHVGNLTRNFDQMKIQMHLGLSLLASEKAHIEELLANNYKVLIYSGQLDVIFPYVVTVNYLKTLNFSHLDEYNKAPRHIWRVDDKVAGYIKSAGSLTEVMVVGAGHMVPTEQPKRAFDLITKFTRDNLPK